MTNQPQRERQGLQAALDFISEIDVPSTPFLREGLEATKRLIQVRIRELERKLARDDLAAQRAEERRKRHDAHEEVLARRRALAQDIGIKEDRQ